VTSENAWLCVTALAALPETRDGRHRFQSVIIPSSDVNLEKEYQVVKKEIIVDVGFWGWVRKIFDIVMGVMKWLLAALAPLRPRRPISGSTSVSNFGGLKSTAHPLPRQLTPQRPRNPPHKNNRRRDLDGVRLDLVKNVGSWETRDGAFSPARAFFSPLFAFGQPSR